jgi:DNA-directed RNA polymerase specialized sigma24 family protein
MSRKYFHAAHPFSPLERDVAGMATESGKDPYEDLLIRLEPDSATTAERYLRLRTKLVKFFRWRRCEDPAVLADETVSRLLKNISTGEKVRNNKPYSYVYGIAINVFREHIRDLKKREAGGMTGPPSPVSFIPPDRLADCRKHCFDKLEPEKCALLEQYYAGMHSAEVIADDRKVSVNALRLQVHRLKTELKDCEQDCLKSS